MDVLSGGLEGLFGDLRGKRGRLAAASGIFLCAGTGSYLLWRQYVLRSRDVKRPKLKDLAAGEIVEDPERELTKLVGWLQDAIVRPLDARIPGRPFEHDLLAFPFTPLVLVVGNHSAGKSTFINSLLGVSVQETGVAPTDDGFTVLQRHPTANVNEDGPTLLSCPENRPFRELQRFGQPFWGHFRRKRLLLPEASSMPYGLQVVDTPGMIDMPVKQDKMAGGRGYNFLEVVRWFAQRADLILLLFDPDRPGTTGESLDVLTKSMAGLDHKFVIVLNKVDQLDSSVDFARAYGTLGWALSKVIPRKDIPLIYTMYNSGVSAVEETNRKHNLPLEAFRQKREEVAAEVFRAKTRHWDNVITTTEETLRQLEMVVAVTSAVRARVVWHMTQAYSCAACGLGLPGLVAAWFFKEKRSSTIFQVAFWTTYLAVSGGVAQLIRMYCQQFEALQVVNLDDYFEQAYAWFFIHVDAEDLRGRWMNVRNRVANIIRAAKPSVASLPPVHGYEIARITDVLDKEVWHCRLLAKMLREADA